MGQREKVGVVVLVGIFAILGIILFFTAERPAGPTRSIEDNVIIEQRMKNLSDN